MALFGRVVDDMIVELFEEPEGFTIDECFHPEVRAMFQEVPEGTVVNSTWNGTEWVPPTIPRKRR